MRTNARASAKTPGRIAAIGIMPQDTPDHPTITRTERTVRGHARSRWAEKRSRSDDLARHYGVSASRVRHFSSDDLTGPLTSVLAAVEDPNVDGEAIVAVVQEALEARYTKASRRTLELRLEHLRSVAEHIAQANQDQALMLDGPAADDAIRNHVSVLQEILNLRAFLNG